MLKVRRPDSGRPEPVGGRRVTMRTLGRLTSVLFAAIGLLFGCSSEQPGHPATVNQALSYSCPTLTALYEMPSWKRDIPGLEEEVITLRPADAAPKTMLIAASSLSA